MKAFFEEYGKIAAVVIVALILIAYIASSSQGGFLNSLEKVKPSATVSANNNSDKLKREYPVLEVVPQKLTAGTEYDLLSFVTEAHSVEEDPDAPVVQLTPTVVKIVDARGNELPLPELENGAMMYSFSKLSRLDNEEITLNSYRITYEVVDNYYEDYPVKTTKTYQFVVD